jgi:hypothetical protein
MGLPHSDVCGSKPARDSPQLFAACHVLLRLWMPRHPPYALSSLTINLIEKLKRLKIAQEAQETLLNSFKTLKLFSDSPAQLLEPLNP